MRHLAILALAVALSAALAPGRRAESSHPSCVIGRVIDGDTFDCTDGARIRLLQINARELSDCGGQWAKAGLQNIFLPPGRTVRLEYDMVTVDKYGRHLAAPYIRLPDGNEWNVSMAMVYVGLAKAAYYGDNARYLDWANAAETWARVARWNMWEPGGPYNGGWNCGDAPASGGDGCDPSYPDVCIPPPPPDLDCAEIAERNFRVVGADPHRFDGDHDGVGCE